MIGLYERAIAAFRNLGGRELGDEIATIMKRLDDGFPDEWLLRWNLLESPCKNWRTPPTSARDSSQSGTARAPVRTARADRDGALLRAARSSGPGGPTDVQFAG